MIVSNGAASGAVGMLQAHLELPDGAQVGLGLGEQRRDSLDRIDLVGQLRQYGRLVATAGADLQRLAKVVAAKSSRPASSASIIRATT